MTKYRLFWFLILVCGLTIPLAAKQSPIRYFYDDLGRLVGVVDASGNSSVYHYDAVGNVTSIDRYTSSQVVVIALSPGTGAVGSTVTIQGSGFSTTPGLNSVSFNGTGATVSSATATELVVTVPSGATTGLVGVTAPLGSASSPAAYVVSSTSLAPTITSFSPTSALAGTSVTITGTNFDTTLANDRTFFNVAYTSISAASTTSLTTVVPGSIGSGRITVATPFGTAVSTNDFIIPPSPYGVSDIQVAGRLTFGTPSTLTVSTANKVGLMLFDGTAGQRVSLKGTNGLTGQVFGCDVVARILNPTATVLAVDACMEITGFIDVATLPVTGTYTILVDPSGTATGSLTLTLYAVPADVTGTLTAGGSAVTVTTTTPGQNGALTFAGTAGQRIFLKGTNGLTGQVFGCDVNVTMLNPDKTALAPATCMEGIGFVDVKTLPATGTYTVKVDPADIATGGLTLTLYNVPADISSSITPGGSAVTVTTTTPGQNGVLTFSGTAGQRVFLKGTNGMAGQVAFTCDVNVTMLNPDGSPVAATCMEGSGIIDLKTLATTGTYTIKVDPAEIAAGSLTLTLYDVPADTSGSITAGGSAVTVTTTTPGQNGTLTFSGTAGQRISLNGTNGMAGQVAFSCDVSVSILNPNGSVLAVPTCMEGSGFIDVKTLGSTGTYTITVDPAEVAVGSVTLTLYSVPADASASVTVGGASATLTTTAPGQNAQATFAGTASQQVTVHLTSNSMGSVTVKLLNPAGTQLTSTTSSGSSFNLSTQTLPTTGTYTIVVDAGGTSIGSITVNVTNP
jgi:YD repeat-containing protein